MPDRLSQAAEDYMKTIYDITRTRPRALTNEIAERMGVTPASATGMVQKLAGAQPRLVDYRKHRGVALTPEGERAALEVIRHHRLLETYLREKLGYTPDEVHDEADRLEHVISEDLEERIARALDDPTVDPHGEPIPDRGLRMPNAPTQETPASPRTADETLAVPGGRRRCGMGGARGARRVSG